MKIISSKLYIPNKNLDILKDRLRNLGMNFIENGSEILNISRHKLARAGNAAIALRVCKLEPIFNDKFDIIGLECNIDKPINTVLILKELAPVVEYYGYIAISQEIQQEKGSIEEKYICIYENGTFKTVEYDERTYATIKSKADKYSEKKITYCISCGKYSNGICETVCEPRDPSDFCSRGKDLEMQFNDPRS